MASPIQQLVKEHTATQPTGSIDASIQEIGERIFALVDRAEPPSLFTRKGLYGALMEWSMRSDRFKTQLFRFVDVLPALNSSREIARHLKEYLGDEQLDLSPALRGVLKATNFAGGLLGGGIKAQITGMARMFMLGSDPREIVAALRRLHEQGIGFTVDILGETVVSEREADDYAVRYLDLMELLSRETGSWGNPTSANQSPRGALPRLNVSLKISALCSQILPAAPDTAIEHLAARLRPILRRAKTLGAFLNFDMESFALKNLTLRLFSTIFDEPEFADGPSCGLALQAYLRDCETDLKKIVAWARARNRRITIRLVKGAYWDYETILAGQRGWPLPVFPRKSETDANFEKLSVHLLENDDIVTAAFATHNVRSIASALAHAQRLGVPPRNFEFQMLYGMADAVKSALLQMELRVREYTPVGELLPGMAYLVRRLLENTSNEGFLANKFARGETRDNLLRNPAGSPDETHSAASAIAPAPIQTEPAPHPTRSHFVNEPPVDFTIDSEREKLRAALATTRATLGRKYPLMINNRFVETRDWVPSLNPANQNQIVGHAARATIGDADAALAAARSSQARWGGTPAKERAACLETLARLLRRERTALSALEIFEAGKNWTEADADVVEAIDFCNYYAGVMRAFAQPRQIQRVPGETNFQHWWPRGVGVVISPWNFPLAILSGMMTAAVVAGNTVILKPSEQTPIIAARLVELVMEAGLPSGVVNLVTGRGSEIGAHLVAHPQIDFVAFTGSMETGLKMWEAAGRTPAGQANLKKVICEMGGKNALIVDGDADLDEAVAGALHSAFGYQGQKCSALSRLIVVADSYDRFVERLIAAAASLRVGPAEEPDTIIGPVIDRSAQRRILAMIETGKTEATLAWQGAVPDDSTACYVPPTVFTDVAPSSRLFREEIFGPVLGITRAADFDRALAIANDSAYALTGGVYSRSPFHLERVRNELVCGNVYINRAITGAIVGRQPFGGFKMSGGGTKAGGPEYLHNFMVPRVVTENCLRRGFAPTNESEFDAPA